MTLKIPTSEQTQSEEANLLSQVGHWAVGIGWRSLERQRQMPEVECRGWSRLLEAAPMALPIIAVLFPALRMHLPHIPSLLKAGVRFWSSDTPCDICSAFLLLLPHRELEKGRKILKPEHADPSQSKYFTKLTVFHWNFVLKATQQESLAA